MKRERQDTRENDREQQKQQDSHLDTQMGVEKKLLIFVRTRAIY